MSDDDGKMRKKISNSKSAKTPQPQYMDGREKPPRYRPRISLLLDKFFLLLSFVCFFLRNFLSLIFSFDTTILFLSYLRHPRSIFRVLKSYG